MLVPLGFPGRRATLYFYEQGGAKIAFDEFDGLCNIDAVQDDACGVLARLQRVIYGVDSPKRDQYSSASNNGEPIYMFHRGKAAVIYAVEPLQGSHEKVVIALHFCQTEQTGVLGKSRVGVTDLQIAKERLHLLRTGG